MDLFNEGVKRIWEDEEQIKIQTACIESFLRDVRHIPKELFDDYKNYLISLGCFYVMNDEYMEYFFGNEITNVKYGVYNDNEICYYYKKLVIPIRGYDNDIKSLCGYTNGNDLTTDDFIKYQYSPKSIWSKGNYNFMSEGEFRKAIRDGYVFIVDGIFDKITLSVLGYNAMSFMGSNLTDINVALLNLINKKIVLPDNDLAGNKLYKSCKYKLKNVYKFKQGKEWDIDDYLKVKENRLDFAEKASNIIKYGIEL